ncbi:hypothetical protein PVAG01_05096 [Phlyctema vagabunda]|uniref:BTB domain-containing protein n=1 Tax=Phlyctema vagabunda TaxID=108571 RepID=A0ABR4PJ24_9HELO
MHASTSASNLTPSLTPHHHPETSIVIFNGFYRHMIHKDILFSKAPFFKSLLPTPALPCRITKSLPGTNVQVSVQLPYATPDITMPAVLAPTDRVFLAFMDWLYNGIQFLDHPENVAPILIQLWVFAERVHVPTCQNACIEGIERRRQETGIIETAMLGWVYSNTPLDRPSALKSLLIDQCVWKLDPQWLLSFDLQFPRDALLDIAVRMRSIFHYPSLAVGKCPFDTVLGRKDRYWALPHIWSFGSEATITVHGEDMSERNTNAKADTVAPHKEDLAGLDREGSLTSSETRGRTDFYELDTNSKKQRLAKSDATAPGAGQVRVGKMMENESTGELVRGGVFGDVVEVGEDDRHVKDDELLDAARLLVTSVRGP